MTGAELFEIHRWASGEGFALHMPLWADLPPWEQAEWERKAYEQDLRDRDESAIVSGRKEG